MRALLVSAVSFIVGLVAVVAGAAAITAGVSGASRTVAMPYDDCLAVIDEAASEADLAPVLLVNSPHVRSARLDAEDGSVTVSCHRANNKLVVVGVTQRKRVQASTQ